MLILELKHLNQLLVNNLHRIRALPFDVIVHLPRSGTIPASLLATYLLKPFASVDEFCAGIVNIRKSEFETTHRILLVDDSIRTGVQMQAAVRRIQQLRPDAHISTLAVYSTRYAKRAFRPTLFLHEHDECEYIYPWFMWKTKRINNCAVDMDGVLCRDCTKAEDDEGELYARFLEYADLKFRPSHEIGYIVTSRLEKYRTETETWLQNNGIKYGQLIMGSWPDNRSRKGQAAGWKAGVYQSLPATLFIESNQNEAKTIAQITGKRVWCIDSQEVY